MIKRFKPMRNSIAHPGVTYPCIRDYLLSLVLSSYLFESSFGEENLVSLGCGCLVLQVTIL